MWPLRWTKTSPSSKRSSRRSSSPPLAQGHLTWDSAWSSSSTLARPGSSAGGLIGRRGAVLLVGDVLTPGDRAAGLVVLLHGDMRHETVWSRAVPVVLAGLEENAVAGMDGLDRAALALAAADALGDEDRLAVRVGVPGGAGAGREMHERGGEGGGAGRGGDGVDVDVAGEPVGRALLGVDAAAGDLHVGCSFRRVW